MSSLADGLDHLSKRTGLMEVHPEESSTLKDVTGVRREDSHWKLWKTLDLANNPWRKLSMKKLMNWLIVSRHQRWRVNKKSSFHNDFQGKDFFLQADFNIPIINILWQLLAGYRFTNDEEHEEGLKAVESVTELFAQGMANSFWPYKLQKVKVYNV